MIQDLVAWEIASRLRYSVRTVQHRPPEASRPHLHAASDSSSCLLSPAISVSAVTRVVRNTRCPRIVTQIPSWEPIERLSWNGRRRVCVQHRLPHSARSDRIIPGTCRGLQSFLTSHPEVVSEPTKSTISFCVSIGKRGRRTA